MYTWCTQVELKKSDFHPIKLIKLSHLKKKEKKEKKEE